jgi:hypothetical protein
VGAIPSTELDGRGDLLWRARPDARSPSQWVADVLPAVAITLGSVGALSWSSTGDPGWMGLALLLVLPGGLLAVGLLSLQERLGFPRLELWQRGILVGPGGLRGALGGGAMFIPCEGIEGISVQEDEGVTTAVGFRLAGRTEWRLIELPQWNGHTALARLEQALAVKAPSAWAARARMGLPRRSRGAPRGSGLPN